MESTGLASFTSSNKLVKKKRRKYNPSALMILLSSSLCYVIKWLAVLDVKNIRLKKLPIQHHNQSTGTARYVPLLRQTILHHNQSTGTAMFHY
jgi:hypothetical protein